MKFFLQVKETELDEKELMVVYFEKNTMPLALCILLNISVIFQSVVMLLTVREHITFNDAPGNSFLMSTMRAPYWTVTL